MLFNKGSIVVYRDNGDIGIVKGIGHHEDQTTYRVEFSDGEDYYFAHQLKAT